MRQSLSSLILAVENTKYQTLCRSMGQVYAIHGLVPSLLIWLAVLLYNPLLAALSAAGALMGSFLPLLLLGT